MQLYRLNLSVRFDRPRRVTILGARFYIRGVDFSGQREGLKKRKWIEFEGAAAYDWSTDQLTIPPRSSITTRRFRTEFRDWDDFDGPIPRATQFLDVRITATICHFDPTTEVVDLASL